MTGVFATWAVVVGGILALALADYLNTRRKR